MYLYFATCNASKFYIGKLYVFVLTHWLSMFFLCKVWTAARSERKAETGVDADRGTDLRAPGKAGPASAGSDPKVPSLFVLFHTEYLKKLQKYIYLNFSFSFTDKDTFNVLSKYLLHEKACVLSHVTIVSCSSLVVDKQPPQVIKTQSKFSTTVRYLLGEKVAPGKPVVLKAQIINELQARNLGNVHVWVIFLIHNNKSAHSQAWLMVYSHGIPSISPLCQ